MSVTTNQKTLRVLVVDDNQDHANSLSMLLKVAGHDSHVCVDAQDCMASVDRLRPDVVLLDLGMPGVSGYEVAEVIKSEADLRHIRLIAITGHGMPLDRLQTKLRGFDQHLLKPIDFGELETILADVNSAQDSSGS